MQKTSFIGHANADAPPPSFAWGTNLANVVLLLKSMGRSLAVFVIAGGSQSIANLTNKSYVHDDTISNNKKRIKTRPIFQLVIPSNDNCLLEVQASNDAVLHVLALLRSKICSPLASWIHRHRCSLRPTQSTLFGSYYCNPDPFTVEASEKSGTVMYVGPWQDTILNSLFQLWMLGALDNLGAGFSDFVSWGCSMAMAATSQDITKLGNKMAQFPLAQSSINRHL